MGDPTFDAGESIQDDMHRHWAYRFFSERGPHTNVNDELADQMRAAQMSEQDIYTVAIRMQQFRHAKMVPPPEAKILALLNEVGADPTEANIRQAQQAYYRAMSEAAALSARRQREGRLFDETEAEAVMLAAARNVAIPATTRGVAAVSHPAAGYPSRRRIIIGANSCYWHY